jgi:hypothetical protein
MVAKLVKAAGTYDVILVIFMHLFDIRVNQRFQSVWAFNPEFFVTLESSSR